MSETVHSPYQHTSNQIAREALDRIKQLDEDSTYYTRLMQIISGAVFEGIHLGLNAVDTLDAQGPAELLTAYNAGFQAGLMESEE